MRLRVSDSQERLDRSLVLASKVASSEPVPQFIYRGLLTNKAHRLGLDLLSPISHPALDVLAVLPIAAFDSHPWPLSIGVRILNLLDTSPDRIRAKEIQAVQMHAQQWVWAVEFRRIKP